MSPNYTSYLHLQLASVFAISLALVSCTTTHQTISSEIPSGIAVSNKLGAVKIYVESVQVVADIEWNDFLNLCTPEIREWQDRPRGEGSSPKWQWDACGGERRYMYEQGSSGKSDQKVQKVILVGTKNFPIFSSSLLTAELITALKSVKGIQIIPTPPSSNQRAYILRTRVTEIADIGRSDSKTGISGFPGISLISIAVAALNPDTTSKTVYVRYDLELIDAKTHRVAAAFAATGASTGDYVSGGFLHGSFSEPYAVFKARYQGAAKNATNKAVINLTDALNNFDNETR